MHTKNSMTTLTSTSKANSQNISTSCINALRFDTSSNNSFDELVTINEIGDLITNNSNSGAIKSNTPTNRTKTPTRVNRANKTPTNDLDIGNKLERPVNSTSPPPPPSIGTLPVINAQSSAPSPTKLPQFYPYTASSGHIMHRPIPILQKADAALSSLINDLTSSPSLSRIRSSPTTSPSPQTLNTDSKSSKSSKSNSVSNSQSNSSGGIVYKGQLNGNGYSKTPSSDQMNELIKINNQQQQLISSLRSSINNNSPLMFNMGFNNCMAANNSSTNNNFNNSNVRIVV